MIAAVAMAFVALQSRNTHFSCPSCGRSFKVSTLKYLFSSHSMGARYVSCPNCGTSGMMEPMRDRPD